MDKLLEDLETGLSPINNTETRPNIRNFQAPQPGSPGQETALPQIKSLGQSFGRIDQANKAIRMHLSESKDPLSEASKIESARLVAKRLDLSLGYVLDNYDQITENITGISNNPQGFLEYISNQYRGGASYMREARLWNELRSDPSTPRRPAILEEIQNLRDDLPPMDTSEKGWLVGSIGSAANMVPYTWAVGKYMIPGAALSLVTRGAAGKETFAKGLSMAAALVTTAGKAISFKESLDLAGGIIFGDLMEMEDENGNPIDESVAQAVSGWARIPYAAVEFLSAEFLLTGSNPLTNLLKKIPKGALEKAFTRSAARTVNAMGLKGAYRQIANGMIRAGGAVGSQIAVGVPSEVMEEVIQGNIQIAAEEMAKQITNELTGSEFQSITGEEWTEEMTETVKQTVGAVMVLQVPWMLKGGIDAQNQYRKISSNNAALNSAKVEEEILDFVSKATDEEVDIINDEQLRAAEEESFNEITYKEEDGKITGTTRTGTTAGTVSYTVDENSVVIDNINLPDATKTEVAADMVSQLQEKFPDLNITFDQDNKAAATIGRAVEDLNVNLRDFNKQIDESTFRIEQNERQIKVNEAEIKTLKAELKAETDEKKIGSLQIQIEQKQEENNSIRESNRLSETRLERVRGLKNVQTANVARETQDISPQEFDEKVTQPQEAKERFINTPAGESFRQKIEDNIPNLSAKETDFIIRLIEMRANAIGITANEWIKENLDEKVFTSIEEGVKIAKKQGQKVTEKDLKGVLGATVFGDTKAIFVVTEATDFNTMVHELGHLFRRDLSEVDQKKAYNWARKETLKKLEKEAIAIQSNIEIGPISKRNEYNAKLMEIEAKVFAIETTTIWTREMEELFAESFESYIYNGQTEHAELKNIFQQFAEYMKGIFQVVKDLKLAPEIRNVFDNILTDERVSKLKEGTATPEGEPLILFQKAPEVGTKNFKAWFKESKVVGHDGKPVIMKHGTTHQFGAFTKDRANIESDMGQGFYFSTDEYDVDGNYAGEGPDLTNRIENLSESIYEGMREDPEAFGFDEDYEVQEEDADNFAREKLSGGEERIIDVYLSLQNPVVVGKNLGRGQIDKVINAEETYFDQETEYDEEYDEYGEPEGTLIDFIQALRDTSWDYGEVDIEQVISDIFEAADYERISAKNLIEVLKKSEGLMYAMDYDNDSGLAGSEIIRAAFEKAGYDGIIDHTVPDKFEAMNIQDDASHVIAFRPEQIKSVENQGTYSIKDPRILFQTAPAPVTKKYKAAMKKAFNKGSYISDQTLQQINEPWAIKELDKRKVEYLELKDFDWLAVIAKESGTFAEFKEESGMYIGPGLDKLTSKDATWLKNFYEIATKEVALTDINTGNQLWLDKLTDGYIKGIIIDISNDIKAAKKAEIPVSIITQAVRYKATGTINEKQIQIIRKTLQNKPSHFRQPISILTGDVDEAKRVDQERNFSEEIGIEETPDIVAPEKKTRLSVANKINDVVTKKKIARGEISTKDINSLFNDGKKLLIASDKEVIKLEEDLRKHDRDLSIRLDKINDYNKRQQIINKDETRKKIVEAIKKERARKKELIAQQKQRKKLKDYARKLGKYVTKKVPGSVHIDYRELIQEIQAGIDPNFRQKTKITEKELDRQFYDEHPELASIIPKNILQDIYKLSLNEMTIEQLEEIKDRIDGLIDMGKLKLAVQKQTEKLWVDAHKVGVANSIRKGEPVLERDLIIDDPRTNKEKIFGALLKTYRPSRIADWLDGGQEFHGITHEMMITGVNKAFDKELRSKHKRQQAFMNELNKLGLKNKDFERIVTIENRKWTVDQIMDVYVGWKNPLKQRAIEFGNFSQTERDINLQDTLIAELTENEKKFADYIVKDYADNYERLREAYRHYTNLDLGQEENYTPIRRMRGFYNADEMDVAQELLDRKSFVKASAQKQFTINRLNIKEEHQQPIQLGLVSSWQGQVEKQEHYINSAQIISRMSKVMGSQEVKQAAAQVHKTSGLIEMDSYIKRYANPNIYKAINGWDPLIKTLRNNSAIAYLAYNMVTMLKQLPSIVYYMSYSTPGDFIAGIFQAIQHPIKTREFVESLDPQMKERSIERYIEEMKQKHHTQYQKIINKVGLTGMKGIMWFDKAATTAGWIGVYRKNERNGRSPEECVRMARQATLHTQPAASAKDVASLYAQDNFLTIFLQFTNQLNQLWNVATYDAPQAIKHRRGWQAAAMYGGLMAGAMAMWMISNRRLPEDKEDYYDIFTDQMFAMLPVGGRIIGSARDGWNLNIPIVTPLQAAGHAIQFAERALMGQDITDVQVERILKELGEAFAISAGVPFTEPKRIYTGIKEGEPFQHIVFGGKLNDK